MLGLTVRWSLADAPDGIEDDLATYVADTSHARFDRLIPDRTLVRNGATLLTLTHPSGPDRERLGRIFAAL